VEIVVILPEEFDHGGTRSYALGSCQTPFLVLLSDDAEPISDQWLDGLLAPFADAHVGVVYGRHVPRAQAGIAEAVFRVTRYPSSALQLSPDSAEGRLFFPASDANVAYRAEALRSAGGFPDSCDYGEDRIVLERLLQSGAHARYAPEGAVWHSHDLSFVGVFARGFRMGRMSRVDPQAGRFRGGTAVVFLSSMLQEAWRKYRIRGTLAVALTFAVRTTGFLAGSLTRQVMS